MRPLDFYNIVYSFGKSHIIPHSELLFRLEPHILNRINEFNPT